MDFKNFPIGIVHIKFWLHWTQVDSTPDVEEVCRGVCVCGGVCVCVCVWILNRVDQFIQSR